MAAFLGSLSALGQKPPTSIAGVREMSVSMAHLCADPAAAAPLADKRDFSVETPNGQKRMRLYSPNEPTSDALVIYIHGGGWVQGSIDTFDLNMHFFCSEMQVRVLFTEYRRAPENLYPAALEDCVETLDWAYENADELGINPDRISLCGDSAGGNLAAAVILSQRLREANGMGQPKLPSVRSALLLYPCVDFRSIADERPSRKNDADPLLPLAGLRQCQTQYAGDADPNDPLLSPLCAPTLEGFPPTVVAVAPIDPVRDEGVLFAARLKSEGAGCELLEFPGMIHGFFYMQEKVGAANTASLKCIDEFKKLI
ncbi:MAG: alpha/beta hydrolase [Pseudomonadota bacterium]